MQAEYSQKKNRIKLRVTTSTGLNLLCTANRSQKIKQLLPHIVKLYEEVKEDQGMAEEDGIMFRPFIKYIRKEEFLIAPSQLVGDIFDDNDEVFCEIGTESYIEVVKKQSKQEKKEKPSNKTLPQQEKEQAVPKTKKIKKKNVKKQEKKVEEKSVNEDSKKQSASQLKQPQSSKSQENHKQVINGTHNKSKSTKEPAENKAGQQSKSKKKNNKNKNNNTSLHIEPTQSGDNNQPTTTPKVAQTITPKVPESTQSKKVAPSGSEKQKSTVKKPQPQQKPLGPSLLSSEELNKFKQMMKKSTSAVQPSPSV